MTRLWDWITTDPTALLLAFVVPGVIAWLVIMWIYA